MLQFSPVLSLIMQIAANEAADAQYEFIEPEHLFIGLCKLEGFANITRLQALGVPESQVNIIEAEIALLLGLFARFNINSTNFRHTLRKHKGQGSYTPPKDTADHAIHRSPTSKQAFVEANRIAKENNAPLLAIFHLLAGLLEVPKNNLATWLKSKGINVFQLKKAAANTNMSFNPKSFSKTRQHTVALKEKAKKSNPYRRNITQLIREQDIIPTVTYPDILLEIMKILNRSTQNNPLLLIGEDTTGTSIVESLAWELCYGHAPAALRQKQIIQANLANLAADVKYEGHFAAQLQEVIDGLLGQKEFILFIDGIEVIIGSGIHRSEIITVAQMIKVAMAQGNLQCIGATIPSQYHQHISQDQLFKQHFQPISLLNIAQKAQPLNNPTNQNKPNQIPKTSSQTSTKKPQTKILNPAQVKSPQTQILNSETIEIKTQATKQTPPLKQAAIEAQESHSLDLSTLDTTEQTRMLKPTSPLNFDDENNVIHPQQAIIEDILEDLELRLIPYGLQIRVTQSGKALLQQLMKSSKQTTAPLLQFIALHLENPIGGMLIRQELQAGNIVLVDVANGRLNITKAE